MGLFVIITKPMFIAKLIFTEHLNIAIRNRILEQSALRM